MGATWVSRPLLLHQHLFLLLADNVAEAAKPSYQDERGRKYRTSWDDVYIDELKRGLAACRVFLFYPVYWVAYSQVLNNFISQGEYSPQTPIDQAEDLVNIDTSWHHAASRHPQRHHAEY